MALIIFFATQIKFIVIPKIRYKCYPFLKIGKKLENIHRFSEVNCNTATICYDVIP